MTNCLYVMNEHGTHFYKVGITTPEVEKRLSNLQTGNPRRLVIVRKYDGLGVRHIEAQVHDMLARYRVRDDGEWFELDSPAQVDAAVARLGYKRPWLSLPSVDLRRWLWLLLCMVIDAILFGNQRRRRPRQPKRYR